MKKEKWFWNLSEFVTAIDLFHYGFVSCVKEQLYFSACVLGWLMNLEAKIKSSAGFLPFRPWKNSLLTASQSQVRAIAVSNKAQVTGIASTPSEGRDQSVCGAAIKRWWGGVWLCLSGFPRLVRFQIQIMTDKESEMLVKWGKNRVKLILAARTFLSLHPSHFCEYFDLAGSGSDAASLVTTAKRDGEHYVLNGTKVNVISNSTFFMVSSFFLVSWMHF